MSKEVRFFLDELLKRIQLNDAERDGIEALVELAYSAGKSDSSKEIAESFKNQLSK